MFRAAFPGAAQKGSALFLAELFLLKQFLGLIEDAAKVVRNRCASKTSSVLLPRDSSSARRDGANIFLRQLCREKTQSSLSQPSEQARRGPRLFGSASVEASDLRLVGRPGFEPGLSASKALDLPLVDRPVLPGALPACQVQLLCEHACPVRGAWQGLCQKSLRACGLNTLLSGACVGLVAIQPEQR